MALRWERIVGHIVCALGQGQVALDNHSDAACRRCAEGHIAAAICAGTRHSIVRSQRLNGFSAVSRALDHAQISVGKYLEAVCKDGRTTVARIADLCGGRRYGHLYPSSTNVAMSSAATARFANSGRKVSSLNASSINSSLRLWIMLRRRPLSALR